MEGRLATSDHELIETTFFLDVKVGRATKYVRNFARGDFLEMRRRMNDIGWDHELESLGVEECWRFIKRKLAELTEALVPMKKKRCAGAPPWMGGEVRRANAWKKWKRTKEEEKKREYKRCETRTKKLIKNKKNALVRHVAKECKLNPKLFHSFTLFFIRTMLIRTLRLSFLKKEHAKNEADFRFGKK